MTLHHRSGLRFLCVAAAVAVALVACGGGGGSGGGNGAAGTGDNGFGITASGPGVLSVSPLAASTLVAATPLGNLNPPGHTLPTDHVYLHFVDPWNGHQADNDCSRRPVYAAGSGVVNFVLQTEAAGDTKVMVQMTRTFYYYYDHVLLLPGIVVGSRVAAGDQIATTTGRCPSIDLGVLDGEAPVPSGWVNPARYGDRSMLPMSPYRYMSDSLKALYLGKVRVAEGVPVDKGGRIDWGVRGRLAGDWFHSSLADAPASTVMGPDGWPRHLAFVYEWFARAPRISVGGTIASPGVLTPDLETPDWSGISVASGLRVIHGLGRQGTIGDGWLLVQMLTDDRLKVEFVRGAGAAPTGFSAAAQEYVR